MSNISFMDGMKILSMARQAVTGAKPSEVSEPAAQPKSTLSDDQAHAFQLMMLVTNQNGSTVGNGTHSTYDPENLADRSYGYGAGAIGRQRMKDEGEAAAMGYIDTSSPDAAKDASKRAVTWEQNQSAMHDQRLADVAAIDNAGQSRDKRMN